MVDLAREVCDGSLVGKRVAVLGAAFKPNSDDIRDSPGIAIGRTLAGQGAEVRLHDPRAHLPADALASMTTAPSVEDALNGADVVLHLTEWPDYRSLDPAVLLGLVEAPMLIDGRNRLDAQAWRRAGWTVRGLGSRDDG
jgi:UDPglucose 6-dehydrogenase